MKKHLLFLLILLFSISCDNSTRDPSSEPLTKVKLDSSPICTLLLKKLNDPNTYRYVVDREMQKIVGPNIRYVKKRQANDLDFMRGEYDRFVRLSKKAEGELYTYSKKYRKRLKNAITNYGVNFNQHSNTTRFATFGDPDLIDSISVKIYNQATPDNAVITKELRYNADQRAWSVELPGDLEGKWYNFEVTSRPGARSQYNEPLPRVFTTYDLTGLKHSQYKTTQVYYLPDPALRPQAPANKANRAIYELNIADLRPPDVPKEYWGTTKAITESKIMQERLKHFDGIEVMPPRNANIFEYISNGTMYLHHWGYMGTDFGYTERMGGIEGMIELIDSMHSQGKVVYIDHVYQHTANDMKEWQWMLKTPYYSNRDWTGCGNTLNISPGTVPEDVTIQTFIRDLQSVGFDGSRQDLFGAVDKRTAEKLRDLAHSMDKKISGEPYGYGGGWARWNTGEWGPISQANLWDDDGRLGLRECANTGCSAEKLKSYISGGHSSWKQNSQDATVILETHDGATAAATFGNDYRKLAQANSFQITAQGPLLMGPGQPFAHLHHELNDTPVDLFNLQEWQKDFLNNFFDQSLAIRKKFSGYFSFDYLDPVNDAGRVGYLATPNSNLLGIHIKKPNSGPSQGELIIIHNMSNNTVNMGIPSGDWYTLLDSASIRADVSGMMYAPATDRNYGVAAHASVILWKQTK